MREGTAEVELTKAALRLTEHRVRLRRLHGTRARRECEFEELDLAPAPAGDEPCPLRARNAVIHHGGVVLAGAERGDGNAEERRSFRDAARSRTSAWGL